MNYANILAAAKNNTILIDVLDNHLQSSRASGEVKETRDTDHWHPSSVNDCPRSMAFTKLAVEREGKIEGRIQRIFDTGHHFGYMMQEYFYDMGILYGTWKCRDCGNEWHNFSDLHIVKDTISTETPSPKDCPFCGKILRIWQNLSYLEVPLSRDGFLGHADGIIFIKDAFYVIELKTIKNRDEKTSPTAVTFSDLNSPKYEHLLQTQMYIWMFQPTAEKMEIELNKGLVLYGAKNTQDLAEFPIKLNYDTYIAPIKNKVDEIDACLTRGIIPNKPDEAKNKSCSFCKWCNYKNRCHSIKDNRIITAKEK